MEIENNSFTKHDKIYIFVIWHNALYKKQSIINDLNINFDILEIIKINWSKEKIYDNFLRFYGEKLLKYQNKMLLCGQGAFLAIIVRDNKAKFEKRLTSQGIELVNSNIFDAKIKYREWVGGALIHCSTYWKETQHDLVLLLGKDISFYDNVKLPPIDSLDKISILNQDVIACNGWNNWEQLFFVLNRCIDYAFEKQYNCNIVCRSSKEAAILLNCLSNVKRKALIVTETLKVNDKLNNINFISLDNYFIDYKWCDNILEKKYMHKQQFYAINKENSFYLNLYIFIILGGKLPKNYKLHYRSLINNKKEIEKLLLKYMCRQKYKINISIYKTKKIDLISLIKLIGISL